MPVAATFCSADAGADAGVMDAGAPDAGVTDAGATDAGATDAGATDAGAMDAGAMDAGQGDAGVDAGSSAPIITSTPEVTASCFTVWEYQPVVSGSADRWTLTAAPEGASIDAFSGAIAWTPTTAQAGTQHLSITAENVAGSDTQDLDVEVSCQRRTLSVGCSSAGGGVFLLVALALARRRR